MLETKIRALRGENRTYNQIAQTLKCSLSTVKYHLTPGRKQKEKQKCKSYRARNPILRKIEAFNRAPIKGLENKITHFNRKTNAKTRISKEFALEILAKQGGICYLTGAPIDVSQSNTYSFDHKIPVSKGGTNNVENLGICRLDVNYCKNDKTPQEFFGLCKQVLEFNGFIVMKNGS